MTFKVKTLAQYEAEATSSGGCILHPTKYKAARRVFVYRHGALGRWQFVCHTCDNPYCIKDEHRFVGTARDNSVDAVRKGRHSGFQKAGTTFKHTQEAKNKMGVKSKESWAAYTPEERARRNKAISEGRLAALKRCANG